MKNSSLPTRLALAAIGIGFGSYASLHGAVSNTNDSGPGSLRQTIADASAGSTITFDPALSGQTITLDSGQLLINKNLVIDASTLPDCITIDANGTVTNHRVMEVISGVTVTLTKLHLTGGKATGDFPNDSGGGILNRGTLFLNQSNLSGNSADRDGGGILSLGGTLTIFHSNISGNSATSNGGGITNSGTLTLDQATLSGNSAGTRGGGITHYGDTLTLKQSTISGNSAIVGGGIFNSATLIINQSTLSGNSADQDGGGIVNTDDEGDGVLALNQSTVADNSAVNGGGIVIISGTLTLANSIVAGNTANFGDNIIGSFTANGNNLTSGDTLLAPLGNYGGPTQTMPPLPGSPAIDAATVTVPPVTADQRGAPRPSGLLPDIGAVEYQPAIVNTAADQNDSPDGPELSLREALAREFVSTITFAPALDGQTLTLTGGQLLIDKDLAIDASALPDGITIDANGFVANHRVMEVVSGVTATLTKLQLTGGKATGFSYPEGFGGGILNFGTLTLNQSTLSGNSADVVGGGIDSYGTLTLNQCTLSGNSAIFGGGIYSSTSSITGTITSSTTLNQCTLTANTASSLGGAVRNYNGRTTLIHCTVSGNSVADGFGGGVVSYGNDLTETVVQNSVISGNTNSDVDFSSGTTYSFTSQGGNLIGSGSATAAFNQTSDIIHNTPLLAPLGNYDGPTQTRPPLPGSPAIDAATVSDPPVAADQRGAPRPNGPLPDIGAVEYQPAIVNTAADQNDSPEGPELSLREALAREFVSTITFASALDDQTITLTGGQLLIDKDLAIDASALPAGITIDANGEVTEHRVMEVTSGVTATLTKLHLTGGNAPLGAGFPLNSGGGISNQGTLTLHQSTLSGNSAEFGGGIDNFGMLTLNQCTLTGNSATLSESSAGGGIFNSGTLTINQSTLSGNSSDYGGGIVNLSTLTLHHSTLSGNSASSLGGGIFNYHSTVTLNQSTLSGNSALFGGGIMNDDTVTLNQSTLSGNSAFSGGGISNGGTLTLNQSTLSRNSASSGGGIHTDENGTLSLTSSIVAGNTALTNINIYGYINTVNGVNLTNGFPLLAPLGNYGGPTQTMPPLPGSPAIDAATVSDPPVTADQRGFARPNGPLPDIGAVEAYPISSLGLADTDSDGIPDVLEGPDGPYPQFTVGIDDSSLDSDGDGKTDAAELTAMTDPLDPKDFFRILGLTPVASFHPQIHPVFDITVKTFPGVNYLLEHQSDLGQPFEPLDGGAFTATKFSETFQVELMPSRDFVRARVMP